MGRNCVRSVDGHYCGRPYAVTRHVVVTTRAGAPADLVYRVDLCVEHAAEYDQDHL